MNNELIQRAIKLSKEIEDYETSEAIRKVFQSVNEMLFTVTRIEIATKLQIGDEVEFDFEYNNNERDTLKGNIQKIQTETVTVNVNNEPWEIDLIKVRKL